MTTKLDIMKYILTTLEIDDDKAQNLADAGITTPLKLLRAKKDALEELHNDSEITLTDMGDLLLFQEWMTNRKNKNEAIPKKLDEWKQDFTEDTFVEFAHEWNKNSAATRAPTTTAAAAATNTTKNDTKTMVKVTLDDFPEFDGRHSKWTTYRKEVKATMLLLQLDDLLEVKTDQQKQDHETKLLQDKEYAQNNKSFHAILSKKTAKGTAASMVEVHEDDGDGALAWADLVEFYDFGGDKEARSTDLMNELLSIKLLYDSPGGFNKYASDFETKANELEKVPFKLEDSFKKTLFLRNIYDKDYTAVKDTCTSKTYRETVNALRTKARNLGRVDHKGPTRGINNRRSGPYDYDRRYNNKSHYDDRSDDDSDKENDDNHYDPRPDHFSAEVWRMMSKENREWIKDQQREHETQNSDNDDDEAVENGADASNDEQAETEHTVSRQNNLNVQGEHDEKHQTMFRDPSRVRYRG